MAFHHAGLTEHDRCLIEHLFRNRQVKIMLCTSTLAMGVNLPAHLVIIKSTEVRHHELSVVEFWISLKVTQTFFRLGISQRKNRRNPTKLTAANDRPCWSCSIRCIWKSDYFDKRWKNGECFISSIWLFLVYFVSCTLAALKQRLNRIHNWRVHLWMYLSLQGIGVILEWHLWHESRLFGDCVFNSHQTPIGQPDRVFASHLSSEIKTHVEKSIKLDCEIMQWNACCFVWKRICQPMLRRNRWCTLRKLSEHLHSLVPNEYYKTEQVTHKLLCEELLARILVFIYPFEHIYR